MMDIVERLREIADVHHLMHEDADAINAAIAEIERLRDINKKLAEALAKAALAPFDGGGANG